MGFGKVKGNVCGFGEFPEPGSVIGGGITFSITNVQIVTFQLKLPSTKSLTIDWGNGDSETFAGQDGTEITKTKNYGSSQTLDITIKGSYKEITLFKVNSGTGIPGLTYDLANWKDNSNMVLLYTISTGYNVGGITYSEQFIFPVSLVNVQIAGAGINQATVDLIINSLYQNLASRPGTGVLNLLTNVAPSATGQAEAAAIAAHGWTVLHA